MYYAITCMYQLNLAPSIDINMTTFDIQKLEILITGIQQLKCLMWLNLDHIPMETKPWSRILVLTGNFPTIPIKRIHSAGDMLEDALDLEGHPRPSSDGHRFAGQATRRRMSSFGVSIISAWNNSCVEWGGCVYSCIFLVYNGQFLAKY